MLFAYPNSSSHCQCFIISHLGFFTGGLSITSNPRNIVLNGNPVALLCSSTLSSATEDPSLLSIMWYHEEMMVQLTSNVSLSDDGTTFINTLIINPFNISSLGSIDV